MKQNLVSRDLLLLAAVAFHRQMFDKAGSLFAAAMQSADTMELLKDLDPDGVVTASIQLLQPGEIANEANTESAGDAPRIGLSAIAKSVGDAMSFISNSAAGEDDGEDEDVEDDEDSASDDNDPADDNEDYSEPEDSDDEQDVTDSASDDFDPDAAGQKVIPSSLSSAAHQGGGVVGTKIKLVMGTARSPVRVK